MQKLINHRTLFLIALGLIGFALVMPITSVLPFYGDLTLADNLAERQYPNLFLELWSKMGIGVISLRVQSLIGAVGVLAAFYFMVRQFMHGHIATISTLVLGSGLMFSFLGNTIMTGGVFMLAQTGYALSLKSIDKNGANYPTIASLWSSMALGFAISPLSFIIFIALIAIATKGAHLFWLVSSKENWIPNAIGAALALVVGSISASSYPQLLSFNSKGLIYAALTFLNYLPWLPLLIPALWDTILAYRQGQHSNHWLVSWAFATWLSVGLFFPQNNALLLMGICPPLAILIAKHALALELGKYPYLNIAKGTAVLLLISTFFATLVLWYLAYQGLGLQLETTDPRTFIMKALPLGMLSWIGSFMICVFLFMDDAKAAASTMMLFWAVMAGFLLQLTLMPFMEKSPYSTGFKVAHKAAQYKLAENQSIRFDYLPVGKEGDGFVYYSQQFGLNRHSERYPATQIQPASMEIFVNDPSQGMLVYQDTSFQRMKLYMYNQGRPHKFVDSLVYYVGDEKQRRRNAVYFVGK